MIKRCPNVTQLSILIKHMVCLSVNANISRLQSERHETGHETSRHPEVSSANIFSFLNFDLDYYRIKLFRVFWSETCRKKYYFYLKRVQKRIFCYRATP